MGQHAIYARVSTTSDDQQNALQQQLDRLRAASPDALEYVDVQSGRDVDRPALKRLLADCRSGLISRVIITRLDRITRSRVQGAELLEFFMQPGRTLHALDDSLDLSTPGGRFMASLLIGWSVAESERQAERVRHGHAARRAKNAPFGPKAPFGYRYLPDKSNYELDPDTKDIARDLIDGYMSGERGLRASVAYAWSEYGVKFGSQNSFKRWLLNPSLAGARAYGVSEVIGYKPGTTTAIRRHYPPGRYEQMIWDSHPPLITQTEYAKLIGMFEMPREKASLPVKPGQIRLMTGLIVCSHCHRKLHSHHAGTKNAYYRCGNDTCERRYYNRIREQDALQAACLRMTELADQLTEQAQAAASPEAADDAALQALRDEVQELVRKNDPDYRPVLLKKQQRLQAMEIQAMQPQGPAIDYALVREFFKSQDSWVSIAKETPGALRDLLLAYVAAVLVKDSEIEGVVLASELG